MNRPRFLQVALEPVGQRVDAAGGDVEQHQVRLAADPPNEGEAFAIGRGRRADRAAGAGDVSLDLTGVAVEALDHVDLAVDVLAVLERLARRRVVGEIEVAAVG